jgi:hypothetical protein
MIGQREAADAHLKRLSTEVTQSRLRESEVKNAIRGVQKQLNQIRSSIEELDRQRSLLTDQLMEFLRQEDGLETDAKDSRGASQKVDLAVKDAREALDRLDRQLQDAEQARIRCTVQLRLAYEQALTDFLGRTFRAFFDAIAGDNRRSVRARAAASLREARHAGGAVADLCDQRDQYLELLKVASVPAVKETLDRALKGIESQIEAKFPGALEAELTRPTDEVQCELSYYLDDRGLVSILVPIAGKTWERLAAGAVDQESEVAVKLAWSFLLEAGLKHTDGEFAMDGTHCVFKTNVGAEDIGALTLTPSASVAIGPMHLFLSPVPTEVQELLFDEEAS